MTEKQEIIKELLENYQEFFHIFGLDKENIEYKELGFLKTVKDDCARMKKNIENLTNQGIRI